MQATLTLPVTPLLDTTLLTNAPGEPRVGHQLRTEIPSADRIDVLPAHPPVAGPLVEIEGIVTRLDGTGAFTLRTPGRDYDLAPTPGAATL